jgi:crotonobetainyl-CoA:carnitine CoA-transferase CaiB-like acyl-CoA transferase
MPGVLPLDHLLVLDMTAFRSGPTAVRQLGDWGARVITIERPVDRAEATGGGALGARLGSDFQNLRRNNESLTLDLKQPRGRELFLELVDRADVVVENFAPGVTTRLGLDWDALHARNPRLVLGSISGFGRVGPWADRPGYDQVAQGMSGLMSVTGLPGQGPVRSGHAVADSSSGIYLAFGILAAIVKRDRSGFGSWVRTSLLEALVAMMDFQAARVLIEGDVPQQQGNHHPTAVPMGTFPASDGVFNLAPGTNAHFRAVCEVLGRAEWADDERYARPGSRAKRRAEVNTMISEITATKPAEHWIEAFVAAGVPAGPVLDLGQMWHHPQIEALRLAQPIDHPARPDAALVGQPLTFADDPGYRGVRRPAPAQGEHTEAILAELGCDAADIARLRDQRVV